MGGILHIECQGCGGAMGLSTLDRVATCTYCNTRTLVETGRFVPEYYVAAECSRDQARRALQKALRAKNMPKKLLRSSQLHSARLYFVPFHELNAKRQGTMLLKSEPGRSDQGLFRSDIAEQKDTRVVFTDVHSIEPAVDLPGWALDCAGIKSLRSNPSGPLLPFDPAHVGAMGMIYPPTVEPDKALSTMRRSDRLMTVGKDLDYEHVRTKRIYYPIWRIRYRYKNRLYRASIDGVTGQVFSLRAPQSDGQRVKWLLGVVMLIALFTGKVAGLGLAQLFWLVGSTGVFGLLAAGLGLALVAVIAAVGWEQFRYPGEIVVTGTETDIVKLNRPEKMPSDRVLEWLGKLTDQTGNK